MRHSKISQSTHKKKKITSHPVHTRTYVESLKQYKKLNNAAEVNIEPHN